MGCMFHARLNELWSIWYTIIVVALQSYLIYLGFERHELYHNVKWPTGGYPMAWLNVYFGLYWACIPLSFLMFAFGVFKSGNIPGDCEKLAAREERTIEVSRNRKGEKIGCVHRLKTLWQHSPPMPQQLHVVIALCQLLAQQLMIAQLYRHGFMNSGDVLNTEMDFIYQRERQLASNLPLSETVYQGFRLTASKLSEFPLSANILPLLMNVRLFGIPLEFFNLLIALIAYSSTYPSVFWRVHKGMSLVFSFHLLVYSATVIWTYFSFTILHRIQEINANNLRPVGLGQYLVTSNKFPFYHPYAVIGTFVTTMVLMMLAPITLYTYAYNKYYVNVMTLQAKNRIRSGTGQSEYSAQTNKSYSRISRELCCDGYGPNIVGIIFLVLIIIAKAPTLYALLILWQHDGKAILLTCLIIDITYFFTWIITWLLLTLKKDWDFNVSHKAHQVYGLQKGAVTGHIRGNENPSQLKNALVLLHGDHMFVTEDQAMKQTLLRHAQRNPLEPTDSFWMKQNGTDGGGRRLVGDDLRKEEMNRLLPRSSMDESMSSYQQPSQSHLPPQPMRLDKNSPQMSSSTLQRNTQLGGMSTLQRSLPPGQWQTSTYASIHKQKPDPTYQRQNSIDSGLYGQTEKAGNNYGTYARLPTQTRVPVPPQQMNTMRINGTGYDLAQQSTLPRRPNQPSQMSGLRQSPLFAERQSHGPMNMQTTQLSGSREQSPYQASSVKMSSFNNNQDKGGVYGSVPSQWTRPSQQIIYSQNKPTISASSSQQDANCYATMSSTITSQTSSQPTTGSPTTPVLNRDAIYGTIDDEKTLQKPRHASGVIRHAVKVVEVRPDDSANYSLSSGGDSARGTNGDFATSIV